MRISPTRLAILALLTALVVPPPAGAALGDTLLVSKSGLGAKGNDDTTDGAVSADGRFVAFSSQASNLHPDDSDTSADVFVRDLQQNTTTLVSRANGPSGAKAIGNSFVGGISADGRFVSFNSSANNLGSATDTSADVFVRDLQQDTTTLVSRATGVAGAEGNGSSEAGNLSANGRFVVFTSQSTNLPDDGDAGADLFVRDLQQNTTALVSRDSGATGAKGNGESFFPEISANGRFVVFQTRATNFPGDNENGFDIWMRDLQLSTTTLVSRGNGAAGTKGNGPSGEPAISADGRFVAFFSGAANLHPDDSDTTSDVFVRDVQQSTNTLVSRATGANGVKGNSFGSSDPEISADGRYVTFGSNSTNLHPNDPDGTLDVLVRDVQQQTTTLVSRASGNGPKGNEGSFEPAISGDGRFVYFPSLATNLSPEDGDTGADGFLRDVLGPPPGSQSPPRITGRALEGETLTCSPGTFSNGPNSTAFQWRRDGGDISGATGTTYVVGASDIGHSLTCLVVATNPGGSASAESAVVVPPPAGPPGPATPGPQGPQGPSGPASADRTPLFAAFGQSRLRSTAGKRLALPYLTTAPGEAVLEVLRGRRAVARINGRARAGRNTLSLPARVRPAARSAGARAKALAPGNYTLRLTIRGADGQSATDSARLTLTRASRR
jgi:Tol biopolymer transport system component